MGDIDEKVAIAAAFFSGFNKYMGLQLCWNGSSTILFRLGISLSKIGSFIGDAGASMYFWGIWGIVLSFGLSFCDWTGWKAFIAPGFCAVAYFLACFYAYIKRFSESTDVLRYFIWFIPLIAIPILLACLEKGEIGKYVCPIVSCISSLGTFITYCIIFHIVLFGHGNEGVRKLYFWLCMSALAHQFDTNLATKLAGKYVAWFLLAIEISYFVIPFIQWFCKRFHYVLGAHDSIFFIVFWQAFSMCAFTAISMELWIISVIIKWNTYSSESADMNAGASFMRCLSPFFMGVLGTGFVFWLFPVVWPFMVVNPLNSQFLMLLSMGLSTVGSLIPWILSDGHEVARLFTALRPSFDIKEITLFNIWPTSKFIGGVYYHFTWCSLVIIFFLFWLTICCIHYPRCLVSRCLLHSRWAVFCGSIYFFLSQLLKSVGINACFANAIGPAFASDGLNTTGAMINGTVKIGGDKSVKIENLNITLDNTAINRKQVRGVFTDRILNGSASLSGKPQISLYGFTGVAKSYPLGEPFGASGTFQGKQSLITLSNNILNLGLFLDSHGGPEAKLIVSLTKLEIRGLKMTSGEEDDGEWITVSSDNEEDDEEEHSTLQVSVGSDVKNVEKMDITLGFTIPITGLPDTSGNRVFGLGGTQLDRNNCNVTLHFSDGTTLSSSSVSGTFYSTSGGNKVVIDSSGVVTIDVLYFGGRGSGLTIRGFEKALNSGNISSSTAHTVILYGTTASTTPVQTDLLTVTNPVGGDIKLCADSINTFKLTSTHPSVEKSIDLKVSDTAAAEGYNKAASFTSSEQGDYLTKMKISLFLEPESNIFIDGFPVGGKAVMTLDFGAGIKGSCKGFRITQNSINMEASGIMFPADFAHGAAFGTVCLDLSLFHMTSMCFTVQAYSVGVGSYRKALDTGGSWPTQGIGTVRSFFWWLGYGFKNGNKRFWSLADVDIISVMS